jgi:hypothetical protein
MWRDAERDETGYGPDSDNTGDYDLPAEGSRRQGDSSTYWRRRFLILCGGVVALGACAVLFPGARHAQSGSSATASASMAALERQQSLPPAATGSAWAPPSPTPSSSPRPTPSAPAKKTSLSYRQHSSPSGSAAASPPACSPADIVLSLLTTKSSYAADDRPDFSVYAVSTSSAPCAMPYGAGSVQVVVTSHGQVVWDSDACKPPAAKPLLFTLGVPRVLSLTWNRTAAGPAGCAGSVPAGTKGSFDAVAIRAGRSSPLATFRLS